MSDRNGWIRKRHRKSGDIWVYSHRRRRWDGKWVEATERRLGTIHELPDEEAAWKRVDELGLKPCSPEPRDPRITFGEVAGALRQIRTSRRSKSCNDRKIAIHDHEVQALSK